MANRSVSPYERYGIATPVEDSALQIHVFSATDTISLLAEKFYGDWRLWRVIANRNKIVDPRKIAVGTELIIPQQPLDKGIYKST